MIDIRYIKEHGSYSDSIKEFMEKNGTNHVKLTKAWTEGEESLSNSYRLMEEQLAYALQNGAGKVVVSRIIGRMRVLAKSEENAVLAYMFGSKAVPDCLL